MEKRCPRCGGKVSSKEKHKDALCNACVDEFEHSYGECMKNHGAVRRGRLVARMIGGDVVCAHCKQILKPKEGLKQPLQSDVDLARKLGISK